MPNDFSPLAGVHVVTIAINVPGPMTAERLQTLGASVLKIEPPDGDPLERASPDWYAQLAAGMTIERLDLKSPDAKAAMYERLANADLLLTSQRPAALVRLGLGWEELHARFPRLCQVAIVGYPSPDQNVAGHDLTYLAANGLLEPPQLPPTLFADVASSESAALAALAVLRERDRTGIGIYREVAMSEAAKRLAAPAIAGLMGPNTRLGGAFPGYNLYQTKNGWIAVAALESHFYKRLCERFNVTSPSYDDFAKRFLRETTEHWLLFAKEHDLPIERLMSS